MSATALGSTPALVEVSESSASSCLEYEIKKFEVLIHLNAVATTHLPGHLPPPPLSVKGGHVFGRHSFTGCEEVISRRQSDMLSIVYVFSLNFRGSFFRCEWLPSPWNRNEILLFTDGSQFSFEFEFEIEFQFVCNYQMYLMISN